MKKEKYFLHNFVFSEYTQTIRCNPQNYWIASVKNNKVVFDSWDAAIIGRYSKLYIRILWSLGLIKP
jgi:hypothetical protein